MTSLFVANVTGRWQLPLLNSPCASCGLAEAKTSAGAPFWICSWSWLEPAKLNVGAASIWVNTSRSEAAA